MAADIVVEIVSPLSHHDTDAICRVAKTPGLVATCAGCGQTVYGPVHLPLIAFGFWCSRCCPCRMFAPTPDELHALRVNRARCLNGEGEDDAPVKTVAVGPQEERRARFRQRCAEIARQRWADPVTRARMVKG